MPSDTKPRWERRKDARPQELLAAALDLFVDRGYAATRLEDVARRAGVSKGTLYLYFDNKEELFKAVVRQNIVEVIGKAESDVAAADSTSCTDLLRAMLRRWWADVASTRASGLAKLMVAEAGNFPEIARFYNEEVIERGSALITSIVQRGVERGEFVPVDAVVMTRVLTAPVTMLMLWAHSFEPCCGGVDAEAFMETYLGLVERGMARPA
ncbi:TetR/AcrR family transcriptional regulator [Pseudoduganella umbonata]|uniref:AcrR family transcriptional regulator n=1 Tax=Pseudoduganella umbonata TaxID=864828 RepID=A0A4P8HQJ6_9BURK|nr:TetR/AcrR family transcriptional regulator [Pseudoduganella umbonata]MBB3220399.1 AcrR family transcriptional regulator [Pseudoduganella umbonata]QCP12069.1 TetR/AcrR family transcriptional regulator [Pseudoduganella umbonata]